MSLQSALEDARLTLTFLPLVARVRWRLSRAPLASCSKAWGEAATRELTAARVQNLPALAPFDVWRRSHAIRRAARFVPGASCLTQALALQSVLSRCGEKTALVLGVDHGPQNAFEAHAWVEWQGRVLIGGPIARWKPLLTVEPHTTDERATPTEEKPLLLNISPAPR